MKTTTPDPREQIFSIVLGSGRHAPWQGHTRLPDTRLPTGEYRYGFAFNRALREPAVHVDEGGESG